MNRTTLGLLAFGCLLAIGGPARAAMIEWGYDWDHSPVAVRAGAGGVSFANEPQGFAKGDSDLVAADLRLFSSATHAKPDVFGPNNGKYTLTFTLTNVFTGKVGALTFTGQFQGWFTRDSANVTLKWLSPMTQSITLGDTSRFTVSIVGFSPPGPPSQHDLGSITSHIAVSPVLPGAPGPEPSSLLLGCVGLTFAGGAAWRIRRRAAPAG